MLFNHNLASLRLFSYIALVLSMICSSIMMGLGSVLFQTSVINCIIPIGDLLLALLLYQFYMSFQKSNGPCLNFFFYCIEAILIIYHIYSFNQELYSEYLSCEPFIQTQYNVCNVSMFGYAILVGGGIVAVINHTLFFIIIQASWQYVDLKELMQVDRYKQQLKERIVKEII